MDCHGRMLAHVLLHESDGIVSMSWNCPDFLVEDSTESDTDSDENILPLGTNTNPNSSQYMAALYSVLILFFFIICFSWYSAESEASADCHLSIRRH